MPLLNMKYNLYSENELLGYSLLEGDDSSMGVRGGKFHPCESYFKLDHLFRALTQTSYDEWEKRRISGNHTTPDNPSSSVKDLRAHIAALNLRVETEDGRKVGTSAISLEDFSDTLGEDGRELSIVVDARETYEEFFG
jgi:hypothetical protein